MRIRIALWVILASVFFCLLETRKIGGEKIIFCDVGQGDAIFVKTQGRKVLIDTGPKNGKVFVCLSKNMPFWDKNIDILMISHGDNDHNGEEDELRHGYKITKVVDSSWIKEGEKIMIGNSEMSVLNSGGGTNNQGSLVLRLIINNRSFLLTGDMDLEIENKLTWRKIVDFNVDVLKVSHHGSDTATGDDFLRIIQPKVAIICVGKNNYGHPNKKVIDALLKLGTIVYRTDEMGDIVMNLN